jgi:hypothetical protein
MPDLILTPPTFAEGQTIEVVLNGKPVLITWHDEDTLVVDGDARPILVTKWEADSIGFACGGEGESNAVLRRADPEALSDQLTLLREQAAAERAERIERVVVQVATEKAAELGRPLSNAELEFVRKLVQVLRGDLDEKAATIRMGTGVAAEA